eukprot:8739679-Pyramimonas_sp.AAC.1
MATWSRTLACSIIWRMLSYMQPAVWYALRAGATPPLYKVERHSLGKLPHLSHRILQNKQIGAL